MLQNLQTRRDGLSRLWKVSKTHESIYTGGKVEFSSEAPFFACLFNDDVAFVDTVTRQCLYTLQQDVEVEEMEEEVLTFALRPNYEQQQIATASRAGFIRLWNHVEKVATRTIKADANAPILSMDFDPSGLLLATGGVDRSVKVYDMDKGFCTHNFRGHDSIVTLVKFHPQNDKLQVVSCSQDTTVRVWDLYAQKSVATFTDHLSAVTSVDFSHDGWTMITAGRDKVLNVWDLRRFVLVKTIPVAEAIEGVVVLPSHLSDTWAPMVPTVGSTLTPVVAFDPLVVAIAGEHGHVRVWRITTKDATCIHTVGLDLHASIEISELVYNGALAQLVAITSEHNLIMLDDTLASSQQIIGYNDQIIALKYIPHRLTPSAPSTPTTIAVATNSAQIRLMSRQDLSSSLLSGHEAIVLALAVSPDGRFLISVAKDKSAKVWCLTTNTCVATCIGHTEAIGAVALSPKRGGYAAGEAYFITGSADKTLKQWSLKGLKAYNATTGTPLVVSNKCSTKGHDKDINALAISPNDRLVASASQDKSVKVWHAHGLTLAGVCRGHKRGVWAINFSPVDQCLASASGDKTIKLWSMKDFSCLKTFEGHTASVLNVAFLTAGMQLMSTGADGLVKLWTIKSNECVVTMDNHRDKVWALDVLPDSSEVLTGGADSNIHLWMDVTEAEELKEVESHEAVVLKTQTLHNLLASRRFKEAVTVAFDLSHPHKLYSIFKSMIEGLNSEDKVVSADDEIAALGSIVSDLTDDMLMKLLKWTRDWNTNAKTSQMAQLILSAVLRTLPPARLTSLPGLKTVLEGLMAYTTRHFNRLDRLMQKSYLVDFTITSMKRLLPLEMASDDLEVEADQVSLKRSKIAV